MPYIPKLQFIIRIKWNESHIEFPLNKHNLCVRMKQQNVCDVSVKWTKNNNTTATASVSTALATATKMRPKAEIEEIKTERERIRQTAEEKKTDKEREKQNKTKQKQRKWGTQRSEARKCGNVGTPAQNALTLEHMCRYESVCVLYFMPTCERPSKKDQLKWNHQYNSMQNKMNCKASDSEKTKTIDTRPLKT